MNKKRILIYIAILAVYFASVSIKSKIIEGKNQKQEVTIASIWEKKGLPVYVSKIKSGTVPKFMKATIKVLGSKKVEITLPATVRPYMGTKTKGDIYIEGRRVSGKRGPISSPEMDYTGFLTMTGFLDRTIPWKKGALKVGRIPYYDDEKKYSYVPDAAIYSGTDGDWIYLVKNNVLEKKKVRVLFSNYMNAAIDGEFMVGDTIVVSDQRDLTAGLHVNAIEK